MTALDSNSRSLSSTEATIRKLAASLDLAIYDVEFPNYFRSYNDGKIPGGTLRVYIEGLNGSLANIEDCSRLARLILNHEEVENLLPGNVKLEVSTPGVERRLRTQEHFSRAFGEEITIRLRQAIPLNDKPTRKLFGTLVSATSDTLDLQLKGGPNLTLSLAQIERANIKYDFSKT